VLDNLTVAEKCSRRCLIGFVKPHATDPQRGLAGEAYLMTEANAAAVAAPGLLDQIQVKIRLRHDILAWVTDTIMPRSSAGIDTAIELLRERAARRRK
ncbi:MAG TPA: hypothetical protein PLP98_03225, partial [Plasticicumulans sp.]|nr:hypothetical protein [Plasticicumulans sp.]